MEQLKRKLEEKKLRTKGIQKRTKNSKMDNENMDTEDMDRQDTEEENENMDNVNIATTQPILPLPRLTTTSTAITSNQCCIQPILGTAYLTLNGDFTRRYGHFSDM